MIHFCMPKRKPVEAVETAPAIAEPVKKTARKTAATTTKTVTNKAAHKHHNKTSVEAVVESVTQGPIAIPVTRDAIASLAYEYWEARGRQGGSPEEDWLRAERALLKLA